MIRAAGIYFSARVIAALCGLLAVAIYTRLATPEIYGIFSLVMTGALTLFAIAFHWIQSGVGRFLPAEDGPRRATLGAALVAFPAVTLLLMSALAAAVVLELFAVSSAMLALGCAMAVAYAAFEITLGVLHALQRPTLYAILLAARALGGLILGCLLLVLGYGAVGLLVGILVAHVLPVAVLLLKWRKRLSVQRFDSPALRRMAVFGLPLAVVGVAASVIGITDRYFLALLVNVEAAGGYAASYDFAQRSLQMLMLSAFLAASPAVFRAFGRGDDALLRRHLVQQGQLILVTALPVATIMAAAAPLIARLLFGEAFRDMAVALIPWIVAATLVQGIQSYYYSYCFTLTERTLSNAMIVGSGAVLNVVMNILLIPTHGVLGAAYATCASVGIILALTLVVTRRWIVLPWPGKDAAKTAGICLLMAPCMAIAARRADLAEALVLTAAASALLAVLLLVVDAAAVRTLSVGLLRTLKRRPGGTLAVQP